MTWFISTNLLTKNKYVTKFCLAFFNTVKLYRWFYFVELVKSSVEQWLWCLFQILRLLVKAWQRRLVFTIGTSATTGMQNTVVWNEIHHKTEFGSNHTGHGYPDPKYFDNVLLELASHGVTEDQWLWFCLDTWNLLNYMKNTFSRIPCKLLILSHFILWKNKFSDISRKFILPNMIRKG